jgi:hypothetical protein
MAKPMFTVTVKSEGGAEFQRVLNEKMKYEKRQPFEVGVSAAYFADLDIMRSTKKVPKEEIESNLMGASESFPSVALGAILINWELGKKNKKGLTGEKMAAKLEKSIKYHQNRAGAVPSGWIGGLKQLDFWNKKGDVDFTKRFAPKKPESVKQYGKPKGYALLSNRGAYCEITVGNEFGKGKQDSATVDDVEQRGMDRGLAVATTKTISYINRKIEERLKKEQRINTFN